VQFTQVPCDR